MLCEGVIAGWRRLSGGMCLQIVWDAERKRWINTDQTEEQMDKPAAPPPKDSELSGETGGWVGVEWKDRGLDTWIDIQVFPSNFFSFLSYSFTCALHLSIYVYIYYIYVYIYI